MEQLLKAKHWQLFLVIVGIPLIFQVVMMASMMSGLASGEAHDLALIFNWMKIFPLIILLFAGVFFGWLWALGVEQQQLLPDDIRLNTRLFKVFFWIPAIYITLLVFAMIALFDGISENSTGPDPGMILLIIPVHLFSMFCIFYCIYFAAKTIKTIELGRAPAGFGEFAGEFFLIWFYPVGVWIIQPKVNRFIDGKRQYGEV